MDGTFGKISFCIFFFQVHYNVGKNLADKGNQTAAIKYYREAVRYYERIALLN